MLSESAFHRSYLSDRYLSLLSDRDFIPLKNLPCYLYQERNWSEVVFLGVVIYHHHRFVHSEPMQGIDRECYWLIVMQPSILIRILWLDSLSLSEGFELIRYWFYLHSRLRGFTIEVVECCLSVGICSCENILSIRDSFVESKFSCYDECNCWFSVVVRNRTYIGITHHRRVWSRILYFYERIWIKPYDFKYISSSCCLYHFIKCDMICFKIGRASCRERVYVLV